MAGQTDTGVSGNQSNNTSEALGNRTKRPSVPSRRYGSDTFVTGDENALRRPARVQRRETPRQAQAPPPPATPQARGERVEGVDRHKVKGLEILDKECYNKVIILI